MSPAPDTHPYASRAGDLDAAVAAGDAPRALAAAGDLLRRTRSTGARAADVRAKIAALEPAALDQAVAEVDASQVRARLERACEEAFEALLEPGEEGALWSRAAVEALRARDALESMRVALDGPRRAALEAKLELIDRGLRKRAVSLVGLNGARAAEAALLDPEAFEAAWWWTARVDSGLGDVLAGRVEPDAASATTPEDERDLALLRAVRLPPALTDEDRAALSVDVDDLE